MASQDLQRLKPFSLPSGNKMSHVRSTVVHTQPMTNQHLSHHFILLNLCQSDDFGKGRVFKMTIEKDNFGKGKESFLRCVGKLS